MRELMGSTFSLAISGGERRTLQQYFTHTHGPLSGVITRRCCTVT